MKIHKNTELDYIVAEELFGWRWLTGEGIPVRGSVNYPEERPVRRFFPPDSELGPGWMEYFKRVPHSPSTGDEDLAYCYCSSQGPHIVPCYSQDAREVEAEIVRRDLWDKYRDGLMQQVGSDDKAVHMASAEVRCLAALFAVDSKYLVKPDSEIFRE